MLARSLRRAGAAQRVLARNSRRFFSSASESASSAAITTFEGPPFARYFWYTTAIMLGIPGAIGGVFVYNLKTDDEFYSHFNDRYPEIIEAIDKRVRLNEKLLELASREDIGPIGSTEDLINQKVTVVAELQSRKKVRLEMSGSASQDEIEALALKQSAHPEKDWVVNITVVEEDEGEKDGTLSVPTAQEAWPPAPRVTWGSAAAQLKKHNKPVNLEKEIRLEIDEIRSQQAGLEESKYAGRDIDQVDAEIAALEERKVTLKEQLPRQRFLWIF